MFITPIWFLMAKISAFQMLGLYRIANIIENKIIFIHTILKQNYSLEILWMQYFENAFITITCQNVLTLISSVIYIENELFFTL